MKAALKRLVWMVRGSVLVVGCALVSCGGALPTATEISSVVASGRDSSLEGRLMAEVNRVRSSRNKGVLVRHAGLDKLARHHSQRMLREGKLHHDGYHHRLGMAEYHLQVADLRENVFYARGISEADLPARTVKGWYTSKGHRMNLLANAHYCGIGVAQGADGRYYATQLVGKPLNVRSFYREGMPRSYSNIFGVGAGGADW